MNTRICCQTGNHHVRLYSMSRLYDLWSNSLSAAEEYCSEFWDMHFKKVVYQLVWKPQKSRESDQKSRYRDLQGLGLEFLGRGSFTHPLQALQTAI